ncbi:hypothetical protein K7X08_018043 [Anisodus acutangulus]|uniref:Phospholipase A1 n=1 Tax=Anisodus acutangulus TaxID=402998 RepID=A0A9Q1R8S1_9SOLA|nr:hypothetical protein K7X08_018043 [Anisodus acutangulus]
MTRVLSELCNGDVDIGIKKFGAIDSYAFHTACKQKFSHQLAEEKATEMCSTWQSAVENPKWNPFKTVTSNGDVRAEIIDQEDKHLQQLRKEWGYEFWNFEEGRKATLSEAICLMGEKLKEAKIKDTGFVKVDQLEPGTKGVNLIVKILNTNVVVDKIRNTRQQSLLSYNRYSQPEITRLAESLVGDETRTIIFTSRNEQVTLSEEKSKLRRKMACIAKGLEVLRRKIKYCLKRKKGIENRDSSIAERWELLSGNNNWESLLDPLDYDLRRYLIHYGQMPQAIYDSFNNEKASKYRGTSRYSKKNLFTEVGLEKNNPYKYEVTKYLYAASDVTSTIEKVKESNWIGFVAVATDEGKVALGRRDILITWRGTIRSSEWNDDVEVSLVQPTKIFGENTDNILIHKGFYSIYTSLNEASNYNRTSSARDQVIEEVKRLLEQYKKEEVSITVTGHSLGSALATLCAIDIVVNQVNKEFPVTAFAFGCPRVGEENFKNAYEKLKNLQILRICNAPDHISEKPDRGQVEDSATEWRMYEQVGFGFSIDTTKSEYLKKDINGHILEVYLHGIAGTQGPKGEFKLEINRDIALVNKADDVLKGEYGVPMSWWIEKNKGMIQQEDGSWILMDHEDDTDFLP